jgi:hypothetical protein
LDIEAILGDKRSIFSLFHKSGAQDGAALPPRPRSGDRTAVAALVVSVVVGLGAMVLAGWQNILTARTLDYAQSQEYRARLEGRAATCLSMAAYYAEASGLPSDTPSEVLISYAEKSKNVARAITVCLYEDGDDKKLKNCVSRDTADNAQHRVKEDGDVWIPIC